jgi:hypothetical protein
MFSALSIASQFATLSSPSMVFVRGLVGNEEPSCPSPEPFRRRAQRPE